MDSLSIEDYWIYYCKLMGLDPKTAYNSWSFGDGGVMTQDILDRVISRQKTVTTSLVREHELKGWNMPKVGDKVIILDANDHPRCIIEYSKVIHKRFSDVSDLDYITSDWGAFDTIDGWRRYLGGMYFQILAGYGEQFDDSMKVMCIWFTVIYQFPSNIPSETISSDIRIRQPSQE